MRLSSVEGSMDCRRCCSGDLDETWYWSRVGEDIFLAVPGGCGNSIELILRWPAKVVVGAFIAPLAKSSHEVGGWALKVEKSGDAPWEWAALCAIGD